MTATHNLLDPSLYLYYIQSEAQVQNHAFLQEPWRATALHLHGGIQLSAQGLAL